MANEDELRVPRWLVPLIASVLGWAALLQAQMMYATIRIERIDADHDLLIRVEQRLIEIEADQEGLERLLRVRSSP